MFIQVQVSQHHHRGQEHSGRVSTVLVLNVKSNVTTSLNINGEQKNKKKDVCLLTGSNMANSRPMLQPGIKPGLPIKPAP